jgi:hypothetical protein
MNPLSDILQAERSIFYIYFPEIEFTNKSINSINPSSPSTFLHRFNDFSCK